MKLSIFKSAFLIITLLVCCSCTKEEIIPVSERLNGVWQINSFKLNSIETIGFVVDDMTIEFSAGDDGKGISKWIVDGDETVATYQLEDNERKLVYNDAEFILIINESTLTLDGMVNDDDVIIEGTKK